MSKHFLLNPTIESQDTQVINEVRSEKESSYNNVFLSQKGVNENQLLQEDNLRHIDGKVVVKIDMDGKDSWTFENGQKIEYKRRFNNFNVRQTNPVNCIVISGEGMKKGAEILIHPNGIHDSNRILDYKDSNDTIRYYSIQNEMCYAWYDGSEWRPMDGFDFALRVFEQYDGVITGIEPKKIKDVLFVTTGEYKNKVVKTLTACDYEIIYQEKNGRESSLIRFRAMGDEKTKREPEAIAIHQELTDGVLSGDLLIGYSISDAKTIQEKFPHDRP